jgi:hypothetical protein
MTHYRIYAFGKDGSITSPPRVIESDNDDSAVDHARWFANGEDVEVWQGARLIIRLDRPERAWDAATILRSLAGYFRKYQA